MISEKGVRLVYQEATHRPFDDRAIIGVDSGKCFASLGTLSADPLLKIWSAISLFLVAIHPL